MTEIVPALRKKLHELGRVVSRPGQLNMRIAIPAARATRRRAAFTVLEIAIAAAASTESEDDSLQRSRHASDDTAADFWDAGDLACGDLLLQLRQRLRAMASGAVIELTHNWETKSYELGNGFGHIAIAVPDAYKACEETTARGGKVTREPGPMKHGTTVIAFVEDPDGYKIEFVQRKNA